MINRRVSFNQKKKELNIIKLLKFGLIYLPLAILPQCILQCDFFLKETQ